MKIPKISFKEKLFSALLMFVIGFTGASVLGAIVLIGLIALGILPNI